MASDFWIHYFKSITIDLCILTNITFVIKWRLLNILEKWVGLLIAAYLVIESIVLRINFSTNFEQDTYWFYNTTAVIIEPLLILFIFYQLFEASFYKQLIMVGTMMFTTIYAFNIGIGQGLTTFNTYSYLPVSIFIAILSYLYMKQYLEKFDEAPFKNFFFWFSMATMLDYGISPITQVLYSWFSTDHMKIASYLYYVGIFFYWVWFILLSVGLLWTKKYQT